MRTISLRTSFVAATLIAAIGCGDDTSATGGSNNGGSGGQPPVGGSPDGGSPGVGGSGGNPTPVIDCIDVEATKACTAPDAIACECTGCELDVCTDGESFNDCLCANCADDAYCINPTCTDDGLCDPFNESCVCADCAAHPSCDNWIEDCGNTTDDNGNGLADCADAQCSSEVACVQPACDDSVAAVLGANTGDTTGGTTLINTGCQQAGGAESVFTFTPATDGFLSITLASTADLGFAVRTECADIATETACVDGQTGGTNEVGAIEVTAGTEITIVVNGFSDADAGAFTLTLAQAAPGGCIDDGACSAVAGEACTCTDCATAAVCGACDGNNTCDVADACTCATCDADKFCTDEANCVDDDFCNQFTEGCQCADCAAVPNCID